MQGTWQALFILNSFMPMICSFIILDILNVKCKNSSSYILIVSLHQALFGFEWKQRWMKYLMSCLLKIHKWIQIYRHSLNYYTRDILEVSWKHTYNTGKVKVDTHLIVNVTNGNTFWFFLSYKPITSTMSGSELDREWTGIFSKE